MLADLRHCEPVTVWDRDSLTRIFHLRRHVWESTGTLSKNGCPKGSWRDPYDEVATHWVIRDDVGRILAAARQTIHSRWDDFPAAEDYSEYVLDLPGPIAHPARMVVCPSAQGQGLASQLIDLQEAAAERAHCRYALRQASPSLVRLLVRRGWEILGPAPVDPRFPDVEFQVTLLQL
jgi:GNAT superfamily N-acetyltransferase